MLVHFMNWFRNTDRANYTLWNKHLIPWCSTELQGRSIKQYPKKQVQRLNWSRNFQASAHLNSVAQPRPPSPGPGNYIILKGAPLITSLIVYSILPTQVSLTLKQQGQSIAMHFFLLKYNRKFDHSTFKEQIHSQTDNCIPLASPES